MPRNRNGVPRRTASYGIFVHDIVSADVIMVYFLFNSQLPLHCDLAT
jgi:hypothetical protein